MFRLRSGSLLYLATVTGENSAGQLLGVSAWRLRGEPHWCEGETSRQGPQSSLPPVNEGAGLSAVVGAGLSRPQSPAIAASRVA